jgi:hypothetical protein
MHQYRDNAVIRFSKFLYYSPLFVELSTKAVAFNVKRHDYFTSFSVVSSEFVFVVSIFDSVLTNYHTYH